MPKRIVIVQGHPDPAGHHYLHALMQAYADGAREAGHEVQLIDVAQLDFPLLRSQSDWKTSALPATLVEPQRAIGAADHLVICFPLWLGTMPALLKAFFEQVFRPGFAISADDSAGRWKATLKGKSARVVVSMGMPAFVFKWYFRSHGVKSLERNILAFCGIGPIRETLIGMIESKDAAPRQHWLTRMRTLGQQAR